MTATQTHSHRHEGLKTTFKGVLLKKGNEEIVQYRGIQYGSISERFAAPTLVTPSPDGVDGTRFGPECPQLRHDIRQLFCIPDSYPAERFEHDEFKCLNLTVTTPKVSPASKLPVMIWIHGGSQLQSVEGPASRMSDTGRVVAESLSQGLPIIIVAMNYRLNVFGLGDGNGERNLALKDQSCAIEWVRRYIAGFNGDPDNITLAGESAGGTYIHAHSILGTPAKRVILQSGTLWTMPPRPIENGARSLKKFEAIVRAKGGNSMRNCSTEILLAALAESRVGSMWLDLTPDLVGWENKDMQVEEMMIGDCEFEAILWLDLLRTAKPEDIVRCFETLSKEEAARVLSLYGIDGVSTKASRQGALNLLGDYRFCQPPMKLVEKWRASGKPVYQYLLDEVNPFRQGLGAHHGVDILFLFGDYDLSKTPSIAKTAAEMRKRWILFVNGKQPWDGALCTFGPLGVCDVLDKLSTTNRRRWEHFEVIDGLRPKLDAAVDMLGSGRFRQSRPKM